MIKTHIHSTLNYFYIYSNKSKVNAINCEIDSQVKYT